MIGFFINGDEVRITKTGNVSVRLETYDGSSLCGSSPFREYRNTFLFSMKTARR